MTDPALSATRDSEVESLLADGLDNAGRALASLEPGLRTLLGTTDPALLRDRVIAQVRALIEDLARQLVDELGPASLHGDEALLVDALIAAPAVLRHAHALALEDELAERLAAELALDPVVSPVLLGIADSETTASGLLTAQAHFVQAMRRGELALGEWSDDVLQAAFAAGRGDGPVVPSKQDNRLALLAHAAASVGERGLDLRQAGVALFLTALAASAGVDRDAAVLLMVPSNWPRLAVALRAAGLEVADVERQLLALHPDVALPEGLPGLSAESAAALLRRAGGIAGT